MRLLAYLVVGIPIVGIPAMLTACATPKKDTSASNGAAPSTPSDEPIADAAVDDAVHYAPAKTEFPDIPVVDANVPAAAVAPACRGADIDLYDALMNPACDLPKDAGVQPRLVPGALQITATQAAAARSGDRVMIDVVLMNTTEEALVVIVGNTTRHPQEAAIQGDFLSPRTKPAGTATAAVVDAAGAREVRGFGAFVARVADANAPPATFMLTHITKSDPDIRLQIAPQGRVHGRFAWTPGQDDPPSHPGGRLKAGTYDVVVTAPLTIYGPGDYDALTSTKMRVKIDR